MKKPVWSFLHNLFGKSCASEAEQSDDQADADVIEQAMSWAEHRYDGLDPKLKAAVVRERDLAAATNESEDDDYREAYNLAYCSSQLCSSGGEQVVQLRGSLTALARLWSENGDIGKLQEIYPFVEYFTRKTYQTRPYFAHIYARAGLQTENEELMLMVKLRVERSRRSSPTEASELARLLNSYMAPEIRKWARAQKADEAKIIKLLTDFDTRHYLRQIIKDLNRPAYVQKGNLKHFIYNVGRDIRLELNGQEVPEGLLIMEKAGLALGWELEDMRPEQCERCGEFHSQLKTGSCCWGCWDN